MMMNTEKPNKTLADYLVISISPALIMLLVGSLSFFLVEVFFRGPAIGSVRWVMFWFVMAVVLVTRIGIEQGAGQAMTYGIGLAFATWLYLMRIYPAFILGMILLGVIWWCAHKLTWDCTLIDDDDDASGSGLLQTVAERKAFQTVTKTPVKIHKAKKEKKPLQPPGLWVVYFSLAALPLFGIGQMFLPRNDVAARRLGFIFLFVYIAAALGLLITTSFLGLRRYLRQRYLQMPGKVALGWVRFGAGIAAFVLIGALLLPRPGASDAWRALNYQVDYRLRQASDYAAKFNPPGRGKGRAGNETGQSDLPKDSTTPAAAQEKSSQSSPGQTGAVHNQETPSRESAAEHAGNFYRWFKILFFVALVLAIGWWVVRRWQMMVEVFRAFIVSLKELLKKLFGFNWERSARVPKLKNLKPVDSPFASFRNPFLAGQHSTWTPEQIILYSFEALQAWAKEHGVQPRPDQTAREFCLEVGGKFPEITAESNQLAFLYSYAAYRTQLPVDTELELIKQLWRFLCM